MAKQTQKEIIADLPVFEDYEESGLLTVVSDEEEKPEDKPEEKEEEKPEEKPAEVLIDDEKKPEEKPEEKPEVKAEDKPEDKPEAKPEDEGDEETIWDMANKITGSELVVDFGETDPETPEGVAIWEAAVRKEQSDLTFDFIKENFPKASRALDYEMNGGNIEDMFVPGEPDFAEVKIEDDNADQQKAFLSQYYKWKNIPDARANKMIEIAEDEGNLAAEAKSALEERKTEQKGRIDNAQADAKAREKTLKDSDAKISAEVGTLVNKGHLNNFTVPQKERKEFNNFLLSHMQRDGQGGHLIVIPVDPAKLSDQAQMLYFGFKGGNLGDIIQREAETKTTRKFKSRAAKIDKETGESGSDELLSAAKKKRKGVDDLPTMEDYTVD